MSKTSAQLDAEIRNAADDKLIAEWKAGGGKAKDRYALPYGTPLYWALSREDQRKKVAAREAKKNKPVNVTHTNLFALAELVMKHGGHARFPNAIEAVDRPHIKRCIDAGYVNVEGRELALTPYGKEAVGDYLVGEIGREEKFPSINDPARQATRVAKLERSLAALWQRAG